MNIQNQAQTNLAAEASAEDSRGEAANVRSTSPNLVEARSGGQLSVEEEAAFGNRWRGRGDHVRRSGGMGGVGGRIRVLETRSASRRVDLAASAAERRGKVPVARSGFLEARSTDR